MAAPSRRVAVLGGGSLGLLVAAALARPTGRIARQVVLLTRTPVVPAGATAAELLAPAEITVEDRCTSAAPGAAPAAAASWTAPVHVPVRPRQASDALPPLDALLVATKHYDAVRAVQGAHAWLTPGRTALVPLANGLGLEEQLRTAFPAQPLVLATTTYGAARRGPLRVAHTGVGTVYVGPAGGGRAAHAAAEGVLNDFVDAGLHGVWDPNMPRRLWTKAAVSACLNGPAAVLNVHNGALASPAATPLLRAICEDVAAVMAHAGVGPVDAAQLFREAHEVQSSRPREPCVARRDGLTNGTGEPRAGGTLTQVAVRTAPNINSMLQDVRAGRPTEVGAIYGYIVQQAAKHGVATPRLQLLHDLVRLREACGPSDGPVLDVLPPPPTAPAA